MSKQAKRKQKEKSTILSIPRGPRLVRTASETAKNQQLEIFNNVNNELNYLAQQ
jgi:hypothetical protein